MKKITNLQIVQTYKPKMTQAALYMARHFYQLLIFGAVMTISWGLETALAGPACDLYTAMYTDVNESIIVGGVIMGGIALVVGVVAIFVPGLKQALGNNSVIYIILTIGVVMLGWANLEAILEAVANFSDGTIDIAGTLAAC